MYNEFTKALGGPKSSPGTTTNYLIDNMLFLGKREGSCDVGCVQINRDAVVVAIFPAKLTDLPAR